MAPPRRPIVHRILRLRHDRVAVAAVALFVLLAIVYTGSIGIRASRGASITGDEPFYLLTTQSLVEDGNFDLRKQYATRSYESFFDHPDGLWMQSLPTDDGRLLSPHDPGLSILVLPGFVLGGLLGVQVQLVLLAALTMTLTFLLIAHATGAPAASWFATAAIGLTATPFIYSSEVYPEFPAALCLVAGLLLVQRSRSTLGAVALVLLMSGMAWLGIKYVPLAAIVALAFMVRASMPSRGVVLAGGFLSAVLFAWGHIELFGTLTPYSVGTVHNGMSTGEVIESHVHLGDRAYRLYGIFIDRRFGLLHWAPLLGVSLLAAPLLWRRREGLLGPVAFLLVVAQLGIATFIAITMMGWWFPGRTMMTVLPLFALPLAVAIRDFRRLALPTTVVLGGWSAAITAALALAGHRNELTIAVDPFELSSPVFRWVAPLFPQYTSWTAHTWIATVCWLAGMLAVGLVLYRAPLSSAARRLAGRSRSTAPAPPTVAER